MAKHKAEDPVAPGWLLQFGDMVTQLLTFFILILTLVPSRQSGFQAGISSIREQFGTVGARGIMTSDRRPCRQPPPQAPIAGEKTPEGDLTAYEKQLHAADQGDLGDVLDSRYRHECLYIQMPEKLLFDPGKTDLREDARVYIDRIVSVFRDQQHRIIVSGHTDDSPLDSQSGKSDWELSALRANSVVRYMRDVGGIGCDRLSALGYGRYHPRAAGDLEGKRASNRRIEIMITKGRTSKWTE